MALYTSLASLSQTAASNVADGSVDAPSTIDQQTNLLASFIAQLRDGSGLTTGVGYLGQCRLSKSGSNILLSRYNGVGLTINGVAYAIPSAGVSLAPTGLSVGTLYYIYAYMNAGTMTLEASTTTHATDTATGIEIKSGDATRTLVGMVRPITGPAFADTASQRFVSSWFNRKPIGLRTSTGATAQTLSGTPGELNSAFRNEFLIWTGEAMVLGMSGTVFNSNAGSSCVTSLMIDGTTSYASNICLSAAANAALNASMNGDIVSGNLTEGYHYLTFFASVSGGGTGNWYQDIILHSILQG